MLDVREAQTVLEDALRDAVLFALGKRKIVAASNAALRAFVTRGANGESVMHDDMLAAVSTMATTGWRWNSKSVADDDDTDVLKPDDVLEGPGRWLRYESPLRIAPTINGNSYYLHEITSGPLERVLVLDKNLEDKDLYALIFGQVPSVLIEATDDAGQDLTQNSGHRWDRQYHFTLSIFALNLRDRRQAARGSNFSGEQPLGANSIDGLICSLLGGTQLHAVVDGVRNVQVGRGYNWLSEQAERRVVRGRAFSIQATVENPAAPNDTITPSAIFHQAEMTTLGDNTEDAWVFGEDCVTDGMDVGLGVGLTKTVTAGTAAIDGAPVSYAGELHTFTADRVTYRDLKVDDGTMAFHAIEPGQSEPALVAGYFRVGVTTTDGSGVIADRIVARRRVPYGPNVETDLS